MRRPRSKKSKSRAVELAITILERKVGPKFNSKKYLIKHGIHKDQNNKYFKIFYSIIEYLEDLRGENKNKIEFLIRDYLTSIYEYYQRFSRIPSLNQISPSMSNKIRFEEWIHESRRLDDEDYWVRELFEFEVIEVPIEIINVDLNFTEVG